MRIHKIVLVPVSADVEIWNKFIENSFVVNNKLILDQFPLVVHILYCHVVMQLSENLLE